MIPIILCCGADGRAVVYGRVETLPEPGQPVSLHDASMILYWPGGGLFGLAASGPRDGTRMTETAPLAVETVWQEFLSVNADAAERIDSWPR